MSLATRCTTCGTVFRVVQDQLKVSEGWVRCGRCEEVFNALEGLFDLEREAPPPWPPQETPVAEPVQDWGPPAGAASPGSVPLPSYPYAAAAGLDKRSLLHADAPDSEPPPGDFAHARFNTDLLAEDDAEAQRAAGEETGPADDTIADTVAESRPDTAAPPEQPSAQTLSRSPTLVDEPPPHFLRQAERAARWRRPGVRAALAATGVLATLSLAAQATLHWRDNVAALWPETRPLVEALCEAAGCRIDAPRRIDALAVEASGLVRLDAANLYRFSISLHNRAPYAVRLPSVDLTLTDAQGQVVARRMFAPAELGIAQATAAAGADVPLQGLLDAGERRLAGYQVEIFYP